MAIPNISLKPVLGTKSSFEFWCACCGLNKVVKKGVKCWFTDYFKISQTFKKKEKFKLGRHLVYLIEEHVLLAQFL